MGIELVFVAVGSRPFRVEEIRVARKFRFNIDLSKIEGKRPPPKIRGDDFSGTPELSETLGDTALWPQQQKDLEQLPVLVGTTGDWGDPLLGEEMVEAYNVSRERALSTELGAYERTTIFYNVFFTPRGAKHVVTRPMRNPNQRISELLLAPNGHLFRLAYERRAGREQDLDELFSGGVSHLNEESDRFRRWPGYTLRYSMFVTQGDLLEDVYEGIWAYDPSRGEVLTLDPER